MMATVGEIAVSVRDVGERLKQQLVSFGWSADQSFLQILGGYSIPLSAHSFAGYTDIVASRVEKLTKAQLDTDGFGIWLGNLTPQLNQIQFNAINQGQIHQITNALSLIQMIDAAIPAIPPKEPKVNWEDLKDEKNLLPRDLKARLRSVDARLNELEPRSQQIEKLIIDIENAHTAANELPTDLAELEESRVALENLMNSSQDLAQKISRESEEVVAARKTMEENADAAELRIKNANDAVDAILAKSEHALRGATSVGLSKSFEARKDALAKAGGWWTAGLAVALIVAVAIGWERVNSLKEVLNGSKSATVILVNALLAVLGIGAPVWFAWLSTKQIGTIFRLSEDYAFKASVAQAYEGYRTEAVDLNDEALRTRLFAAALDRFEEAPIRLIEATNHSTPLQELLSNASIKDALEKVPNVAEKILALIPGKSGNGAALIVPAARRPVRGWG